MKKKLLLVFAISSCMNVNIWSQITLNQYNVATPLELVKQANDTLPAASIVPGSAGTNQTWNFSALHNHKVDSLAFTNPAFTAYPSAFPSSNLAVVVNRTNFEFLVNNANGLYVAGAEGSIGDPGNHIIKETYTPQSELAKWPATFSGSWTDNYVTNGKSAFNTFAGYDSVRIKNTTTSTCTYDAWGSVQTPFGTFPALRLYRHQLDVDTTWIHNISPSMWLDANNTMDTVDSYNWWTNAAGTGFPLVSMNFNASTHVASKVTWLLSNPTPYSVVELSDFSGFMAFPNPAGSYINVKLNTGDAASAAVMDMSGRMVTEPVLIVDQLTRVNTESLDNGIYFLIITGKNGQRCTKKFSVVR
jgi:hypothetical protein